MKHLIFFVCSIFCCVYGFTQQLIWASHTKVLTPLPAYSRSSKIDVDTDGNIYTLGFFTGTIDLDPGPDTVIVSLPNPRVGVYLVKQRSDKSFVWGFKIGSLDNNVYGQSIAVDHDMNVYIAGSYAGMVDFDPGPQVVSPPIMPNANYFPYVCKFDSSGHLDWASTFPNSTATAIYDINIDNEGHVYTLGQFTGTCDFDPGPGVFTLTSAGPTNSRNGFISKLDSSGSMIWTKPILGNSVEPRSMTFDTNQDIIISGDFFSWADFDPGPGVHQVTVASYVRPFLLKLTENGDFSWANHYGGNGLVYATDIKSDPSGNIYVCGKFSQTGNDMDPGPLFSTLPFYGIGDAYILKLDSYGSLIWGKSFGGTEDEDALSIEVDAMGNVYITGVFRNTVDFDPGSGTVLRTASHFDDFFLLKLNPLGNFVWAGTTGGTYNDELVDVKIDGLDVYVTGCLASSGDLDLDTGVYNYTCSSESFTLKLRFCDGSATHPQLSTTDYSVCPNTPALLQINGILNNGITWEIMTDSCHGAVLTTTNAGQFTFFPEHQRTYYVRGLLGCQGINQCDSISFAVLDAPNVTATVNTDTICSGSSVVFAGTGADTYAWSGGITEGMAFIPAQTDTYYVTGTHSNGCTGSSSVTVVVNTPQVFAHASDTLVCPGAPVTLTGGNAVSFSWSNAVVNAVPFFPQHTATYIFTGIDSNSCTDTIFIPVVVWDAPIVIASTDQNSVCAGQEAVLYGSGAVSYAWSGNVSDMVPFVPQQTTFFYLTGTDTNGCIGTDSIEIEVHAFPSVSLSAFDKDTVCLEGGLLTLPAGSPSGGTYSGTGITGAWLDPLSAGVGQHELVYSYTGLGGCTASDTVFFFVKPCTHTGIISAEEGNDIRLYPNPAAEVLHILAPKNDAAIRYIVFDVNGKQTISGMLTGDPTELNISSLSAGAYRLTLERSGKPWYSKTFIKR